MPAGLLQTRPSQPPCRASTKTKSSPTTILPVTEPVGPKNKKLLNRALLMDSDPEGDLAIFRRFGELNIRNLLYMQESLVRLERELCRPPQPPSNKTSPAPSTIEITSVDTPTPPGPGTEQHSDLSLPVERDRESMLQLRTLLSEYNAALLAYSQILQISRPGQQTISNFVEVMENTAGDERIDFGSHSPDLVRLIPRPGEHTWLARQLDRFTFIQSVFGDRVLKFPSHPEYVFYQGADVEKLERFIICLMFCVMLLLPTILLSFVTSRPVQLAITASFTLAGCFGSAALTHARNWEVLSVTAGYCAILIVFLGNLNNSPLQS